uniref:Uncharacterized protein n=1 Tax=Syphacia muris TaxID=451379 RepID=A0A0N5AA61_9BILA
MAVFEGSNETSVGSPSSGLSWPHKELEISERHRSVLQFRRPEFGAARTSQGQQGIITDTSSRRLAGLSEADIIRSYQESLKHRRTSLPVTANALLANRAPADSCVREARGIIVDVLENKDLSPSVASCLRAVASLLSPQPPPCNLHEELGLPMVIENPFSGEQLIVSSVSAR